MSQPADANQEPLDLYSYLGMVLDQTASIAWQKLGLQPDPLTQKIHVDFESARVAIDVVASLGSVIEPKLDEADRRQLQSLIRDLRINFVEKQKELP